MNRTSLRAAAPMAAALALALGLTACGASNEKSDSSSSSTGSSATITGTLNAGGSTAQQAAVASWTKAFQTTNTGVTVNYDPVGSGGGREQFIAGGLQVAGTDAYLTDDELTKAKAQCKSDVIEVPVYISPIAVVFNVKGVKDLQLSPKTLAAIFDGSIKTWDDAAIKADNPDASLPSTKITAVHRSDDSGTTQNFTDYLKQASGGEWTNDAAQTWPFKSGEGAEGTSGVIQAVTNGNGTIGYADDSQAGSLGVAKIKVGSTYNAPTAAGAAAVLDESKQQTGRSATDLAINIDRTSTAANDYPIILASYQVACADYGDSAKNALVKGWLKYVASDAGQQAAAKDAGSAPLPSALSTKVATAVDAIK